MAQNALARRPGFSLAPSISPGMLSDFRRKAESALATARKVRERGEGYVEQGIRSVEIGTTAFGLGFLQGRYGAIDVLGIPVELLGTFGGHLAGFLELAGKHSWHFHNIADGSLATYAATLGRGLGIAAKKKADGKVSGDEEDGRRGATASEGAMRDLADY